MRQRGGRKQLTCHEPFMMMHAFAPNDRRPQADADDPPAFLKKLAADAAAKKAAAAGNEDYLARLLDHFLVLSVERRREFILTLAVSGL